MSRHGKKVFVIGLISVMVAVLMITAPSTQAIEGDHDGDIVISISVTDGGEPVEDAEIDIYNSTDDLVDAGETDEDGTWIVATNESLESAEIRVYHEDYMEDAEVEEINISLPSDGNETVYETYSFEIGGDLADRGRAIYEDHTAVVLGGGILLLGVMLVIINKKRIDKGW